MCEFCNHEHHHHEGGEMTAQMNGHDHMHGHCVWNKHRMLRIVLLLAMLFFVFWVGVKVGEFRGEFGYGRMMGGYDDYGYRSSMMRGGNVYYGQPQGRGMMGGYYYQQVPTQQTTPINEFGI